MEDIDTEFVKQVKTGDVMVAGWNFGCGSSREHAPIAIKASGISLVIAKSFARIHQANLINFGILPCIFENPSDYDLIDEYDELYEKWMGHRLTKKEASSISGVYMSNIAYLDLFEDDLYTFIDEYQSVCLDLESKRNTNHNSFGLALKDELSVNLPELSINDISKALKLSISAVKKRLERARNILKEKEN